MSSDERVDLNKAKIGSLYRLHRRFPANYSTNTFGNGRKNFIYTHWTLAEDNDTTREYTAPRIFYGQIVLITQQTEFSTQVVFQDDVVWIDHQIEWVAVSEFDPDTDV